MSRSDQKVIALLITFFDHQGVVHHKYVPQGVTVNAEYYEGVLRCLREDVRRKPPALWQRKNWLLHHDNARPHTALRIREFLARNNLPIVPQSPYSPDLSPADFFLFPRMKLRLKGRRFATRETIISESQEVL
jgi:histone-lysine N-methyltransferase SETMAR